MSVALASGLCVNHNAIIAAGILGVGVKGNFEATCGLGIRRELPTELPWEFCFHAIKYPSGILLVASASAVVDEDVVRSCLAASKLF